MNASSIWFAIQDSLLRRDRILFGPRADASCGRGASRKAANLEDILRPLGQFLVDPDVFLEHGSRIQLGLVVVANFDVTCLHEEVMISAAMVSTLPGYSLILAAL